MINVTPVAGRGRFACLILFETIQWCLLSIKISSIQMGIVMKME
jgi:hypothetical protein|tara:strand:+ start:399 stop:530 length:132 start_codon:yes stop_codon:yes gene_type:complete